MKKYAIISLLLIPICLAFGNANSIDPLSKNEVIEVIHLKNHQYDSTAIEKEQPKKSPSYATYDYIKSLGKTEHSFFNISPTLYRKLICVYLI